jgi:hypothetical protein
MKCETCIYYYKDDEDDTFPTCHNDETCDYEGADTQENKDNVIYVVSEENHGVIGHARTREAAIRFLIEHHWIAGHCEYWTYETQTSKRLDELHEDWQKWLFEEATGEDLECLGFIINKETLYE